MSNTNPNGGSSAASLFRAGDAREAVARKKSFKMYQNIKEEFSRDVKKAVDEGYTYKIKANGENLDLMMMKVLAALELGYEVKNVKVKEDGGYAEFYWDDPGYDTITITTDNMYFGPIATASI